MTEPSHELSTWGSRLRRQRVRPPRRDIVASVLLHVGVVGGLWLAGVTLRPQLPDFEQYRVTLVSPPAQVEGEPQPVETTTPVVAEPEPEPQPVEPTPAPTPTTPPPQTQAPVERPVERPPEPTPARGPDPKPVSIGGEDVNVNIEGAEFPYPDYLQNIQLQLSRYFRPGAANLEAEVVFYILRDGSVGPNIRVVRRSPDFNFNLQAVEAVERAGQNGVFGPLPDGWQGDRLWISFTFYPRR
ncbi:hypothetical protein BH23GEM10_BH23GEM10_11040 [soil metagenome]